MNTLATVHMLDFNDPDRALCGAFADSEVTTELPERVTCNSCLSTLYPELYWLAE
jgi:hypothetical protein